MVLFEQPITDLPWTAEGNGIHSGSSCVATTHQEPRGQRVADAAFIVRACNAHDDLVDALKAVDEVFEDQGPIDPDMYRVWRGVQRALARAERQP